MSSKNIEINETYLDAVHFLPDGTQWTGAVHLHTEDIPSPSGYVGFMTGESYSSNSIELTTFPTHIYYPESYDPATVSVMNTVFRDAQSSSVVSELEIGRINSSLNVLKNTINLNKQSINSAVNQIVGAVDTNINQLEENGVGIIEDSLSDDVVTLNPEGVTSFIENVSSVTYHSTTGNDFHLFHGNAETNQVNEEGWSAIKTNHITVDMISRIDTLSMAEIAEDLQDVYGDELLVNDFRYIGSNTDTGFSGKLEIILDTPSKITHLKLLFGTLIDITAIYINDDTTQMAKQSWNLYTLPGINSVYNINIYFQCFTPEPFKSSVEIDTDYIITDLIQYLWELAPDTPNSQTEGESDSGENEGGDY